MTKRIVFSLYIFIFLLVANVSANNTIYIEVEDVMYFSCFGNQVMLIDYVDEFTSIAHCENYPPPYIEPKADEASDGFSYVIMTGEFDLTITCIDDPLGRDIYLNSWPLSSKTGIAECLRPPLFQQNLPIISG